MPSLLNPVQNRTPKLPGPAPEAVKSEIGNRKSEIQWLRLGYLVILVCLVANWVYLASGTIQLSQDEAYQWVWSKHLALSYYSKPPGIAFIQFVSTSLFGDNEFGVRFFSPLFAAILSVMVLRFLAREIGALPAFWFLLILAATPLFGVGMTLMTIDAPLVLCWTWAFVAGWRAVQPGGQTRHWLVVGLAMGLGFLCKYSAVYQIVCWAIFFALWPPARVQLRRPGPWLALLVFLICTTPVVVWNWQHGWITVQHVAGNAGLNSHWQPTLRYFRDFLFQELAVLNPIFFIGALWAMIGFWRSPRHEKWGLRLYFFCMGAPVFLGHWLYSLHSHVLPNWIAPAVVPMFCLMAAYWNERRRLAGPFFAFGLVLGFFTFAILHQSKLVGKITGEMLPGSKDPTRRVQAWKPEAALVEAEREKLQQSGKPAFIICGHYGITGLYSFYIPQAKAALASEPLVYAMDSDQPAKSILFLAGVQLPRTSPGSERHLCQRGGSVPIGARLVLEMADPSAHPVRDDSAAAARAGGSSAAIYIRHRFGRARYRNRWTRVASRPPLGVLRFEMRNGEVRIEKRRRRTDAVANDCFLSVLDAPAGSGLRFGGHAGLRPGLPLAGTPGRLAWRHR